MRITEFPIIGEVKDEYIKFRRSGVSRQDAEESLKSNYQNELTMGSNDDGLLFWVGLADGQYACKEITSEVASQALAAIEKIKLTDWEVCEGDLQRRIERYGFAPMPERKCFRTSRKFRCSWKIGDTFAYPLSGPAAEEYGLEGAYVILRKVAEVEDFDGRILPVVTLSMWKNKLLPRNQSELQTVPVLKLAKGRLSAPGNLYEYRAELIISSKKKLENLSLIYLGNYPEIPLPDDEFVQDYAGFMMLISLDRFMQTCLDYWNRHCILSRDSDA